MRVAWPRHGRPDDVANQLLREAGIICNHFHEAKQLRFGSGQAHELRVEPLCQQTDSGPRALIRQVLLTKSKQGRWNVTSSDTLLGGPRRGNEKGSDIGRTRKCCITFHCFNCPWRHPLAEVSIQMTCFVCRAHDIIATIINLFLEMCQRQQRPFHTKTSESVEEYGARDVIVGLSSRTWRKLWLVRERSGNAPEIHHCRVDALCLMIRSWHEQQLTVRTFRFAISL